MPSCPAVGMHGCWDWTEALRLYQLSYLASPPSDFTCWHALLSQQKLYEQHKLSWMVKNSNRTQSWIGGVALGGSEEEVNIVIYSSRIYPVLSSPQNNKYFIATNWSSQIIIYKSSKFYFIQYYITLIFMYFRRIRNATNQSKLTKATFSKEFIMCRISDISIFCCM